MTFDYVVNNNAGLGDCLSCFNTDRQVWSPSPHFSVLRKYSSLNTVDQPNGVGLDVCTLDHIKYPNQHLFNRVRMASGLEPLDKPRAVLDLVQRNTISSYIAFSFDVGSFAQNQTFLHPRPRQLYEEHRQTIQEFISMNSDRYQFVEVGVKPSGFVDVLDMTGVGLDNTIHVLSTCKHYFGMHSGMMHLATAVGLGCSIIINFPTLERIKLDSSLNPSDAMDWEKSWLYPQHDYFHEDVPGNITVENLKSSIL